MATKTDPSVYPEPLGDWKPYPAGERPKAYTEASNKVFDGNPGQLEGFSEEKCLKDWAKYAGSGPDYGNVTHKGK
jgi:hypothetical protein